VNCAGACRGKPGKFELARRGTIFLDEIGEVPLRLQAKLLHVLADGEFARVGGDSIIQSDVRVIAATNRDLGSAIESDRFREDLYYRLNVIAIRIPPLRDRPDEIRELENAVKRMVVLGSAREATRDVECVVIRTTLERVKWNRTKAARLLKISYRTLLKKIGEYGLAGLPSENAEPFVA
jgi:transcriptional regulator with PAS, ATPase and Fis domain